MLKLFVLFIVSAVATADSLGNYLRLDHNARIVGGRNASIEEFPYLVSIQLVGDHMCGGGIISEQWVLTARTCVVYNGDFIRAGSTYFNKGGSLHMVTQIIKHEKYNFIDYKNRVAVNNIQLLRVLEPFKFDKTRQPMVLFNANEEVSAHKIGELAGWGFTENLQFSQNLKAARLWTITAQDCKNSYNLSSGLQENQFCVSWPGYADDAGSFDVGSPFAIDGRIAGLVSWGNGGGAAECYGVYTKISSYIPWIQEKLRVY
ncbi:trypsin epsilon-like [Microplitis mediator]|uniref:trypsin epsilon-like n=1 Tax=Microplitis mediator TaxID=375433 RepID=UPI00255475A5|nr:trypsin epsilon-like [Microplitis mediator]